MDVLETARLVLRPLQQSDLADCARIWADPRAARHSSSGPMTAKESRRELLELLGHRKAHGFGSRAMVDRESGALVGVIELGYAGEGIEGLPPDDIEVGWVVAAHAWGRRLATEGAAAVVADAFSQRGLERLFAYVRPANRPSIRVAEKLGMRHVRDGRARNGDPVRIYELAREPGV